MADGARGQPVVSLDAIIPPALLGRLGQRHYTGGRLIVSLDQESRLTFQNKRVKGVEPSTKPNVSSGDTAISKTGGAKASPFPARRAASGSRQGVAIICRTTAPWRGREPGLLIRVIR